MKKVKCIEADVSGYLTIGNIYEVVGEFTISYNSEQAYRLQDVNGVWRLKMADKSSTEDILLTLSIINRLEMTEAGLEIGIKDLPGETFSKEKFFEGSFTKELIILMEKHLSSKPAPKKRRKK
jgi:hypothetical protein